MEIREEAAVGGDDKLRVTTTGARAPPVGLGRPPAIGGPPSRSRSTGGRRAAASSTRPHAWRATARGRAPHAAPMRAPSRVVGLGRLARVTGDSVTG